MYHNSHMKYIMMKKDHIPVNVKQVRIHSLLIAKKYILILYLHITVLFCYVEFIFKVVVAYIEYKYDWESNFISCYGEEWFYPWNLKYL